MEMAVPLIRLIYANAHSGPQHGIGFIYENDFCHYWVLASHAYLFGSKSRLDCFKVLPLELRDRLIGGAQSNIKLTLRNNTINKTTEMLNISK